ncbi:MAG TPA: NUDIX domain-containing protein [Actinomycetaceae bacterium]|nr:NUDIX domain-containing protein [Actinomycetaceae bacterium]
MSSGQLGPEWLPGPDGIPFRRGARILLLDPADRLLLVRGHDIDDPARSWWFTVGGGIDPGETAREAAVRELREETGVVLAPTDLHGPVARRSATFHFLRQRVRQDEEFFFARTDRPQELTTTGWTEIERQFMDEARWWPLEELTHTEATVYPASLAAVVGKLRRGWDGTLLDITE